MNNPHEQQAAAMARTGELTDGEQLRECVNSGQVSAAQVVAHAEAGELRLQGSPFESKMAMALHAAFFDGWGACRDAEFVGDEAANDAFNQSATLGLCLSIDQNPVINHAAALAAERAEAARLRDALTRSMTALDDWTALYAPDMCSEEHVQAAHDRINEIGTLGYIADIQEKNAAALAAPGEKHE